MPRAVTLEWAPSPEAAVPGKIIGYKAFYSTQDFTAPPDTNAPPIAPVVIFVGDQTTVVITNLVGGLTYYFAVVAVDNEGIESPFSNVASFTMPPDQEPPPPPPPPPTNSVPTEISLLGMLPRLWLSPTNGQAALAVSGTVGATFSIQASTNPAAADSWVTLTNFKLSAVAPGANTNLTTTLERAFVPALETIQDPDPINGALRCYRIYMPLGYAILANQVLAHQYISSRLIAVRLPGVSAYIVCHVTSEAAYLDYNDKTYIVKLEACGPTIREIANKVAATLGQNWTSASEFTVTDEGAKLLFATVVQTDDPSTDPPLGIPRIANPGIVIDF